MSNDNETPQVKVFTKEELALTQDERDRCIARMALDVMEMMKQGMPEDQAKMIGIMRHIPDASYTCFPAHVNGINSTCIAIEVGAGKMTLFVLLSSEHEVKVNGEELQQMDLKDASSIPKNKLN